jgi:hypothetical protein
VAEAEAVGVGVAAVVVAYLEWSELSVVATE